MAEDWRIFADEFSWETRAVDLWRFLEEGNCSLREAGARLVAESEPGGVLIGYSMGGRLALQALLAAPGHWAGAVIVSAHPGLVAEERAARVAADAVWARDAREDNWADFLKKWHEQGVLESDENWRWGDRGDLESRREAVARSFEEWSLGRQEDLRSSLAELQTPILWLTGEKDAKFCALAEELAAAAKNIVHKTIRSAGHRVPWENAGEFISLARNFCQSL